MIFGLFGRNRRRENRRIVADLYATLTAAGRQPALYERMDVPDTVMGRFEMLSAHVILFLRRARNGDAAVKAVGQEIVDEFFLDIDHSIRELGIGDMGVPKKMKKFGRMFYGRVASYGKALDAGDEAGLAEALRRNILPAESEGGSDMRALGAYLMETEAALARIADAEILSGALPLPVESEISGEPA